MRRRRRRKSKQAREWEEKDGIHGHGGDSFHLVDVTGYVISHSHPFFMSWGTCIAFLLALRTPTVIISSNSHSRTLLDQSIIEARLLYQISLHPVPEEDKIVAHIDPTDEVFLLANFA